MLSAERILSWVSSGLIAVGSSVLLIVLMQVLEGLWFDGYGLIIGGVMIVAGAIMKGGISQRDIDR